MYIFLTISVYWKKWKISAIIQRHAIMKEMLLLKDKLLWKLSFDDESLKKTSSRIWKDFCGMVLAIPSASQSRWFMSDFKRWPALQIYGFLGNCNCLGSIQKTPTYEECCNNIPTVTYQWTTLVDCLYSCGIYLHVLSLLSCSSSGKRGSNQILAFLVYQYSHLDHQVVKIRI